MTLDEIWAKAREMMGPNCKVCPECDGRACRGRIPGVGAMGDGSAWTACVEFLKRVKIRMDTIHEPWEPDSSCELFGVKLSAPLCLAPIGGLNSHNYNGAITTADWSKMAVAGSAAAGILPFTGDGAPGQLEDGLEAAKANGGFNVCTIKPWRDNGKLIALAQKCAEAGCPAVACDIDAAAFANMGTAVKTLSSKSVAELRAVAESIPVPFIAKGVMTAEGALKCAEAGCAGIIVSTHGGRVMTDAQATAEVLPEIRAAVGGALTVIVDGGIRTGADIFKVLALGADAAMIGRPFVVAAHGGGVEGVKLYAETKRAELEYMMTMANCPDLASITRAKVAVA